MNSFAFEDNDVRRAVNQLGGVDKFLNKLSDTMAKNLPQQLDKDTRFVSVLSNGNTINFLHMITNVKSKKDILDKDFISTFIKFQTNKICTSSVSKILVNEFDATYHYQYVSSTGEEIFVFDVKKKNCVK